MVNRILVYANPSMQYLIPLYARGTIRTRDFTRVEVFDRYVSGENILEGLCYSLFFSS